MRLDHLSDQEIKEALVLQERLDLLANQKSCQTGFLDFIEYMWPEFICGRHHKIFAEKLEGVANGTIKRLIVNMPPRHTKSEFASTYFPAWITGKEALTFSNSSNGQNSGHKGFSVSGKIAGNSITSH